MASWYGVIYLVTNLVNNKHYVGQTTQNPAYRWTTHCHPTKANKCMPIVRAIEKYGKENFTFEIIAKAHTRPTLNKAEARWIKIYKSNGKFGYNVGKIVNDKICVADSTRKKMSDNAKRNNKRPEHQAQIKKLGLDTLGKKMSPNTSSKFIGVYKRKNVKTGIRWRARISFKDVEYKLGTFTSEIEAAKARDIASIYYFGVNAPLNFPSLKQSYINGKITVTPIFRGQAIKRDKTLPVGISRRRNSDRVKPYTVTVIGYKQKEFKTKKEAIEYLNLIKN